MEENEPVKRRLAADEVGVSKRCVNPLVLFATAPFGFSQAVLATGATTLHISGQTAWNAAGHVIGGVHVGAQMRQALQNVRAAVEAAGGSMADVVALRIYIVNYDRSNAEAVSSALRECFPDQEGPAATWIGVQSLAIPDFLVEVEATAVIG